MLGYSYCRSAKSAGRDRRVGARSTVSRRADNYAASTIRGEEIARRDRLSIACKRQLEGLLAACVNRTLFRVNKGVAFMRICIHH